MEHEAAVKTMAVERYVLGELTLAEREELEEHFFGCPVCAEQVQSTSAFADNALAVMQADPAWQRVVKAVPADRKPWFGWLSGQFATPLAVACALFLMANILQFSRLRTTQQELALATSPQSVTSATLSQTRDISSDGLPSTITVPSASRMFELVIDVPPGMEAATYSYILRSETESLFSGSIPAATDNGPLRLLLPTARLADGRYTLRLQGGRDREQEYRFALQKR